MQPFQNYHFNCNQIFNSKHDNITINMYPNLNKVSMILYGPSNLWFGIGFDSTDMPNTYSIICSHNHNINEHKLHYGNPGQLLTNPSMINILSDIIYIIATTSVK